MGPTPSGREEHVCVAVGGRDIGTSDAIKHTKMIDVKVIYLRSLNHLIHSGDNGRVLGYDSAQGHHHRHYKGKVTAVGFESFEQIEARFQR